MAILPRYNILDWKVDRLPAADLRALQSERLRNMVRYVWEETPFWRAKMDVAGVTPQDIAGIEDISKLPTCDKAELLADQAAHPPFGSYVGVPRSHWFKMTATSGTTGTPLKRVYSQRDWECILDRFRRNPTLGPGDVVMILGPTDGLIGPTVSAATAERCGAMVIYGGRYDTETKIRMLLEMRPKLVSGTASYLLHLVERARDMGLDLRAAKVRTLASVGEPGVARPATKARLETGWGAAVRDGFGMTELFPIGGSCPESPDIHVASDMTLVEVLDPETGVEVRPGETGELVVTNLVGESQPLLRFRSRDLVRRAEGPACGCGFTGTRLAGGILGRVDDMIWFRGANIYPGAIEEAVRADPACGSEYRIRIDGEGERLPTLTVVVEPARGEDLDDAARSAVQGRLAAAIRVNPRIEVVPSGSLPRVDAQQKAKRVIDNRSV